jgi:hypothetical protein
MYFETATSNDGQWMVIDRRTHRTLPRHASPIRERDTFVIFDDARSRGADMKLRPNAVAGLTLGSRLTKDKLMQGAGRMRQLGKGQTLQLLCPREVRINVCGDSREELTVHNILQWVMSNTYAATRDGLHEWARQGLFHSTTTDNPDLATLDDDWSLEHLYKNSHKPSSLAHSIEAKGQFFRNRILDSVPSLSESLVSKFDAIEQKIGLYGQGLKVVMTDQDEQCEREVQEQEQAEEEVQQELAKQIPIDEPRWEYEKILNARSAAEVADFTSIETLAAAVESRMVPAELALVNWSACENIYGTASFFNTVRFGDGCSSNMFLRHVDPIVVFPDESLLLVSDREADAILNVIWQLELSATEQNPKRVRLTDTPQEVKFVNFCRLRDALQQEPELNSCRLSIGSNNIGLTSRRNLVALQLFNGETSFKAKENPILKSALEFLLQDKIARKVVQELLTARGTTHNWKFSDLETVCESLN